MGMESNSADGPLSRPRSTQKTLIRYRIDCNPVEPCAADVGEASGLTRQKTVCRSVLALQNV